MNSQVVKLFEKLCFGGVMKLELYIWKVKGDKLMALVLYAIYYDKQL